MSFVVKRFQHRRIGAEAHQLPVHVCWVCLDQLRAIALGQAQTVQPLTATTHTLQHRRKPQMRKREALFFAYGNAACFGIANALGVPRHGPLDCIVSRVQSRVIGLAHLCASQRQRSDQRQALRLVGQWRRRSVLLNLVENRSRVVQCNDSTIQQVG